MINDFSTVPEDYKQMQLTDHKGKGCINAVGSWDTLTFEYTFKIDLKHILYFLLQNLLLYPAFAMANAWLQPTAECSHLAPWLFKNQKYLSNHNWHKASAQPCNQI